MYRIRENDDGTFVVLDDGGSLAVTTASEPFRTRDRELAEEAVAYLNQPREGLKRRRGSHRIKSIFGVL